MDSKRFPLLIAQLHKIVKELDTCSIALHADGHLVGSIGEALAAYHYGLTLFPPSTEGKDAQREGKDIEIKAAHVNCVAFRCEPKFLLVLKIFKDGTSEEVQRRQASSLGRAETQDLAGQWAISNFLVASSILGKTSGDRRTDPARSALKFFKFSKRKTPRNTGRFIVRRANGSTLV